MTVGETEGADTETTAAADRETAAESALTPTQDARLRIVLAKLGLDGHDRGLKVVARILRDAGMEVIYLGLRQTTESIVTAAEQEDADAIGLSMHNAGHLTLAPAMVSAVAAAGMNTPVVVGGIVPEEDVQTLLDAGVATVLGPGASAAEVAQAVRDAVIAAEADAS
ncbi:MAG: cobalamin-dependent protein [Acidimicrobiia bacterium]|nr:cobalamin-dependent protein [Acidimicrobiia bacterium]MDH5519252.1 cobalamin-dependent protein [Acidimicrobiia bacterium]